MMKKCAWELNYLNFFRPSKHSFVMSAFFAHMITAVVEVFVRKASPSPQLEISVPVLQPRREPKDSGETSFDVSDDDSGSLSLSSD